MFDHYLKKELELLKQKGLRRELRIVDGSQGATLFIGGEEYLNFCSNNYLGLANDPRLAQAMFKSVNDCGLGSGASRLVCGNMQDHVKLEQAIADFKGTEAALVFSTGYMANVGIISALVSRHDRVFCDKLNHASILDGIQLSRAQLKRYPHRDMAALEQMVKEDGAQGRKFIITDSVFSMDGDIASLDQIVAIAEKYGCEVMVDEAHAVGVLGKNGKGAVEHFGLENKIDIQMGTLSKAVGCFGAYCCGSRVLIDFLKNNARSFIYTTGMPPGIAAVCQESLRIIQDEPSLRRKLWDNVFYLAERLKGMGLDIKESATPIIPVMIGDAELAVAFSRALFARKIFISAIRPPTVPPHTSRLRLTVMATHKQKQLDYLLKNLNEIGQQLDIIK